MGHEATDADTGRTTGWRALDALVAELIDARRRIAAAQADEARLLADAVALVLERAEEVRAGGDRRPSSADLPLREVCAELAAAMRLSDRSVQRRMGSAATLVGDYSLTFAAWRRGAIDADHAAAILDAGIGVDPRHRERYERLVLAVAEQESPARVRSLARDVAAKVDPAGVAARIEQRGSERCVRVIDLDDGISRLLADLPTALAHAIYDRLTQFARATTDSGADSDPESSTGADSDRESGTGSDSDPESGTGADSDPESGTGADADRGSDTNADGASREPSDADDHRARFFTGPMAAPASDGAGSAADAFDARTMDQRRADLLADMLLTAGPVGHGAGLDAITAHVQVTVPVLTLAGTGEEPAIVPGHGPVDLDTARRLTANTPGWDRVLTDPYTCAVLAVDRYRVPADLARFLRARDERCRHPGCGRDARGCDIDHTRDAARGGPTSRDNLAHLCRRHHTLKHATSWRVRQLGGGVLEWTGPTGRRYVDRPPATVRFVPTPNDPPPF